MHENLEYHQATESFKTCRRSLLLALLFHHLELQTVTFPKISTELCLRAENEF